MPQTLISNANFDTTLEATEDILIRHQIHTDHEIREIYELTELFASLLVEALYRRITKLTAKKIIPVADWAKNNGINLQSATNKAIRGTIPAFRVSGHWMIDGEARP